MHESVLLTEILGWLTTASSRGGWVVDGTVGAGGHAAALLEELGAQSRLIGLDKDPAALKIAGEHLKHFGERVMLFNDDYKNIGKYLQKARSEGGPHALLLDLGVSSMQLDQAQRGFSFSQEGPLDMRMDPSSELSAYEIVNRWDEDELKRIFSQYGEERFSGRIARNLCQARQRNKISSTRQLADIIFHSVPAGARHGRIHPATRCFQALRIVVNGELECLDGFLKEVCDFLPEKARLAIISFHSLEDRMVKHAFKAFAQNGCGRMLTKKPISAGPEECLRNPRSRSAKLRVFEAGPRSCP